ncbi:porin family protein [Parasphingopyxis algicola]|uniref:outer membrane protein n=1 Tax=Parasphingopyxis algicola TaxID=2026624 RepID=UPI00159FC191|nr:outer membrane beta-barrel protein [Parasphingopyxis algicola]QLC25512.1 porin family protein [Parasphingopyxis algicola]
MRMIILGAALAAGVSTPALAQTDGDAFTGFRLEALGGYDSTNADNDGDFSPGTQDRFDDGSGEGLDGFLYGIGVGYDFAVGGAVLGIEGEWTDSTAGETDDGAFGAGSSASFEAERDFYVGARVGVPVASQALLYAKGGYTNARFGLDADDGAGFAQDFDATLDGFRVGAGIEYLLGRNVYGKVEYRYSNYSDLEVDVADTNINFDDFDVNTDRHQVLAGVGIRF